MAKNKGSNSTRKKPRNRSSKAQRLRREKEKLDKIHSKLLKDKEVNETAFNDQISPHFEISPDLPNLCIEVSKEIKDNIPPNEVFLCNMSYVIEQAKAIESHSYKCNFGGKLLFQKVLRCGLFVKFHYVCSNILCKEKATISSDTEKNTLNQLAVLGALSTGSGFSQEEEKFSVMNVQYISKEKFARSEKIASGIVDSCAQEKMLEAIQEEKRLAQIREDIDPEGYHCITVIVDGGWCKRSYGHGYNASSGVSVIIGMLTQKILFIGVRNKVCLICTAISKGTTKERKHNCWKNWKGPSTAMESDSIVEGLLYLEKTHGIRCTRLVGDGDSNTITKCRERVSYGGKILKVECANHAVRRYGKALQKIQLNTARFKGVDGIRARQVLKQRMMRLIRGARNVIKANSIHNHNQPQKEAVLTLIEALRNVPKHVFGEHKKCKETCARKNLESDEVVYPLMLSTGILHAIESEIGRVLISCSNTLIWNATNNPAENYMSQVCKVSGGKRVDFSKAGGFNRRSRIAVLSFQSPAQQWYRNYYKSLCQKSPAASLKRFLTVRRNNYLKRLKRRKLFGNKRNSSQRKQEIPAEGDSNYGSYAEKPDLPKEMFDILVKNHFSKIQVGDFLDLEIETRGQSFNERWRQERALRLSSSIFKEIACRRSSTPCCKLVKRIVYRNDVSTLAIKYGLANENIALKQYEADNFTKVKTCGLFVHPEKPFLCSSPDGLIGNDGLVEVKCPYSARYTTDLRQFLTEGNKFGLKVSKEGDICLPESHKFYYQIQGQLFISNREWCDLYVWCEKDAFTLRIFRNEEFWKKVVPKLENFYMQCVLPEIIDGRAPRNLPLREPLLGEKGFKKKKLVDSLKKL